MSATGSVRKYDVNGYLEIAANPLSRAGIFPYTAKSIGAPGWEKDPGRIVMVWRPSQELNNPETLDSVRLQPWTDDHTMLGDPQYDPTLTPPERKGVHGTIGERVFYDTDEETLKGNLRLWSASLADAIDAGKKELSMGFRCVYEFVTGLFEGQHYDAIQRNIRFNHLALVQEGRMGPGVAVLDHAKFTFDAADLREISPMPKTTRRIALAKKLSVAPAALAAAIGMDAADAATLAKWNAAMDAEEETADDAPAPGGEPTITEAVEMIKDVAGPVAELQAALGALAGGGAEPDGQNIDDDMEPMVDAAGAAVMDPATGKQKMKAKTAPAAQPPAVDATPPALAACDSAIKALKATSASAHRALKGAAVPAQLAAFDASIVAVEAGYKKAAQAHASKPGAALDASFRALEQRVTAALDGSSIRGAFAEITKRDALAKSLSNFVGVFDASEMTEQDVAKYGADKLDLKAPAGSELAYVKGFLHQRVSESPRSASSFSLDAAPAGSKSIVSDYVAGRPAVAA